MGERGGGALLGAFQAAAATQLGQKRWNKADEPWQLFSAFFSKLQIYKYCTPKFIHGVPYRNYI